MSGRSGTPALNSRLSAGLEGEAFCHRTAFDTSCPSNVPNWGLSCIPAVEACLRRIGSWRVPPNWSAADWFEEMRAIAIGEAWQAGTEFDDLRGVPLGAFVHSRILGRVLARYRQEWSYGLHCPGQGPEPGDDGDSEGWSETSRIPAPPPDLRHQELWEMVSLLESRHRRLVIQLFSEGRTEAEIARQLGLSQRAISKRKQAALDALRRCLKASEEKSSRRGSKTRVSLQSI
jgi:DNA-directed RNA polymerase specialized sigma24 family protein